MLPSHRRAIQDLLDCRTEGMGGHLYRCEHCGHERYAFHSCRNRACPKCHGAETKRWLEKRRQELLPVAYFHLVFTLPKEIHRLVRGHQRVLYSLLMQAAAHSLIALARDPRYVGATIGILCVLHTWTRAMAYHPHVHLLVPAGGLSPDRTRWIPSHKKFLVPVQALSRIFRAKFICLLRKVLPDCTLPESIWDTPWVVYCKPTVQGPDKVLSYLARYVHRMAITNSRIQAIDDRTVTFRYKDSQDQRSKTMTLVGHEFLRRFLEHVLPEGFHKIRYYGFLSPSNRHLLESISRLCTEESDSVDRGPTVPDDKGPRPCTPLAQTCPHCHSGLMISICRLPPRWRAPP